MPKWQIPYAILPGDSADFAVDIELEGMNRWAKDDPLFADGHYVEDWELRRFDGLSATVQAFIRVEAARGNKVEALLERTVFLSRPPSCGVLDLPDGLSFVCPLQHEGVRVYDGDEAGVILSVQGDERIYPSGCETPHSASPESIELGGDAA